ncbi:hypothetical protein A7N05_19230 [Acinetobacter baumannii]|nr:hypothetical protein A7N05_19230 [Acinetobacter baumannii]
MTVALIQQMDATLTAACFWQMMSPLRSIVPNVSLGNKASQPGLPGAIAVRARISGPICPDVVFNQHINRRVSST